MNATTHEGQRAATVAPTAGAMGREARPALWLPTWSLFAREVLRFVRQRGRVLGSLGTPLLFWVLLGSGFGRTLQPPGATESVDYLTYFFPGTLLLVVLFTAIFSSISIILDRREGFLQGVLVAPVSRLAIVLGKVLGGAALGLLQGVVLLLLAPLAGLSLGPVAFLAACGVLALTSLTVSALGFAFAWRMDSVQGFHAVMNLLLIPLWLLSGAFFPAAGASFWVRAIMAANPLAYALTALRGALEGPAAAMYGGGDPWVALGVLAAFTVVILAVCLQAVRRPRA